ncbi:aminopeptidase-like protein [Xylariaceae sp. FL0804]|nr:aminopeptidase-like protein [Xylariaceae sp. FL0804]
MKPRQLPLRRLGPSLEQYLERPVRLPTCPRHARAASPRTTPPPRPQPPPSIAARAGAAAEARRRTYSTAAAGVPASQLLFGQPVHETHPHLLEAGELTPGITAQEYHERRAALCRALPPDAAVLLPSADVQYRSGSVFHAFRQESNFLYLTGFSEPQSFAVLRRVPGQDDDDDGDYIFSLFCRPKNPAQEQWTGPFSGLDAARDVWNADETGDIRRLDTLLADALRGVKTVVTDAAAPGSKLGDAIRAAAAPGASFAPLQARVNALRVVKSPAEVANMRRAGRESGRALTEAMRRGPWRYERDLADFLDAEFRGRGLDGPAYIPVVASGPKNLLIHYTLNNGAIGTDDLVLVDAGGERGTYITDITRVWPARGTFSPAQRALYAAVLAVQRDLVSLCRADNGGRSLDGLHDVASAGLRERLGALGFRNLDGSGGIMSTLFPHHVGHHVGLDVHDCPGFPRARPLAPGHCVTVEPGVYVPRDCADAPPEFRGLGVRIEDSVCVGADAPLVLTTEAVKEIEDIEALRAG